MEWIEKFIEMYDPCKTAVISLRAGNFETPQIAWDGWTDGTQMLWLLSKLDALTTEHSALISCLIVRKIAGGAVWRLLSENSQEAIIETEKWLKGNATVAELEANGVMAAASAAAALAVSRAVAGWSAELWAARAVSRAVDETPLSEAASEAVAVTAAVMSAVAGSSAESEEARQEIAEIVRHIIPVCPFPVK